jgi:DNA invertase Pin-like site-specific DNA recombinase
MTDVLHIYTRVSTQTQEDEGTSLDTQLELGVQRAEKLGMTPRVWNEGGRSSSKDDLSNRPVLTELWTSPTFVDVS